MTQPPHPPQQNPYATNQPFTPLSSPYGTAGGYEAPQPGPSKEKSSLGIAATVLAVVGTVISCIPVIYVVGWIMLAVAFICGILSLFISNQSTLWGVGALLISVVGCFLASIVFFFFMAAKIMGSLPDTTLDPGSESSIVGTTVRPWGEEGTSESTGSPTPTATEL